MLGRIKRYITECIARHNLNSFIIWQANNSPSFNCESDYTVISFSGSNWFADQLYSIYSFYNNVGRPLQWIVYNDGTYSASQVRVLQNIDRVIVRDFDFTTARLPFSLLQEIPTMKKVEIIANHIEDSKLIFADSDILFYRSFTGLLNPLEDFNYFLVDEGDGYFDVDFTIEMSEISQPFNFGFLIFHKRFDIEIVYDYLERRLIEGNLGYWSDQTGFQKVVSSDSVFLPLDKDLFKVGGSDSFDFSNCVNYNEIVLRHFVGPVRHKMWQYPWKNVLGL